jgi:UDP-N-acetylmuramoyl-tripeptide--D-alanyl-D-alanine ligase
MKKLFRETIFKLLSFFARKKLENTTHQIAITGSVGKSSCKNFITQILKAKFLVSETSQNYNTEFGIALSVLKEKSGNSNPFAWISIIVKSAWKSFFTKEKFDFFVAEAGVDSPNDMARILQTITPKINIITEIAPVHLAEKQFRSEEDIFLEKSKLFHLAESGFFIFNIRNKFLKKLINTHPRGQLIPFGEISSAKEFHIHPAGFYFTTPEESLQGITSTILYNFPIEIWNLKKPPTKTYLFPAGIYKSQKISIPVLGGHHMTSAMPAIITALIAKMSFTEIQQALDKATLPPGRMNLLNGINSSKIIDSSYNASPKSMQAAIDTLAKIPAPRKIAVLGSMNELGALSSHSHTQIGEYLQNKIDLLITVGENAKTIAEAASNHLSPNKITSFRTAEEAGDFLKPKIQNNDLILVKGSRYGVFLEKCIAKIAAPNNNSEINPKSQL